MINAAQAYSKAQKHYPDKIYSIVNFIAKEIEIKANRGKFYYEYYYGADSKYIKTIAKQFRANGYNVKNNWFTQCLIIRW